MAIEVSWHDEEKTVLVWKVDSTFTVEDYRSANRCSRDLHSSVSYDVTTVFDVRQLEQIPDTILHMFPSFAAETPDNQYMAMLLGATGIMRTLVSIYSRVFANMPMVESMDEVYALIHDHREEIIKKQTDQDDS